MYWKQYTKKIGVYKDEQTVEFSLLPPKKFVTESHSTWCKNLHEISSWSSGYEKYVELEENNWKIW